MKIYNINRLPNSIREHRSRYDNTPVQDVPLRGLTWANKTQSELNDALVPLRGRPAQGVLKTTILCLLISLTGLSIQAQDFARTGIKCFDGISVSSYSGSLSLDRQDLLIPGRGPNLDLSFHYNSGKRGQDLGVGNGWFFQFFWRYSIDSLNNILLERPNGRKDYFVEQFGIYPAPPGVFDDLSVFNDTMLLTQKDGLKIYFEDTSHMRITRMVDRMGNEMAFSYTNSVLDSVTDATGRKLRFSWTNNHLSEVDFTDSAKTKTFTYDYDGDGNLIKVTDPLNQTIEYAYDTYGNLIQQVDKNGGIIQIAFTSFFSVDRVVSCYSTLDFSYNSTYRKTYMVETVKGQRQVTTFEYDTNGNLANEQGNCCGFNSSYSYDANNNITSITDANGGVIRYTYDSRGNRLSETHPDGAVWFYTYEPVYNNMTSMTDPLGNVTRWDYNLLGLVTQIVYPLGCTESFTYDPLGNMTSWTDKNGNTTNYLYNLYGYLLEVTDPLGHKEQYSYDFSGNRAVEIDKNGNMTIHYYDLMNQKFRTDLPTGDQLLFFHDLNGNLVRERDANGYETQYTYDPLNRLVSIENALGGISTMKYDERDNMIEKIDYNGNLSRYTYNSRNRLVEEYDPMGNLTSYTYDGLGNVASMTDANGNVTTFTYDFLNRPTSEINALGNTKLITYDLKGNIASETDPNGNVTSYTYDALDRMTRMTDALSNSMQRTYDCNGNILTETDKNGNTTTRTYDAMNRLITETNALGQTKRNRYDPHGNLVTMINGRGDSIVRAYDALHRLVEIQDELGNTLERSYDGHGNLVELEDFRGNITTFQYDRLHRLTLKTNPEGNTVAYTYDGNGNKLTMTDENGDVSTSTYDARNKLTSFTNGTGETVRHTYDAYGNPIEFEAINGNVITYSYDAANRPIEMRDNKGLMEAYTFDANGNLTSKTNGEGETASYTYDALNRVIAETDPLGNAFTYTFDPNGNQITMVDALGRQTSYGYDALNRKTSVVNALNETITRAFDANHNMTHFTDGKGNVTRRIFDAKNQVIQEIFPGAQSRTFTYDEVGNRISYLDSRGVLTQFEYDGVNRLTKRDYPTGIDDTYTYDGKENILTATNAAGTVTRTYDAENRITSENFGGKTVNISFDLANDLRTITYPSGRIVEQELDSRGLIGVSTVWNDTILNVRYDKADRLLFNQMGNGLSTTLTYDGRGNPISMVHSGGVANFGYSYDAAGNRIKEAQNHHPTTSATFGFDAAYRLDDFKIGTLSGQNIPSPIERDQFTYDDADNLATFDDDGTLFSFTSNTNNQYTARSGGSNLTFTHDADGNMTGDGSHTYGFDRRQQMTSVDNGNTATYVYDALGRRVSKTVGSNTTTFFYVDKVLIEEYDGTGALQAAYFYGQITDEPIAMDRGADRYYFHQNAQSSVIALTDSVGQIVERYSYDGFGNVSITDAAYVSRASSAVGNTILFTGQYYDAETGLYYFRARHYHPEFGRFMQRDPLAFNDGANLYHGYFLPSDTDPMGMSKRKIDIELFAVAAYEGLGGGASVTEEIEEEDCCKGKELIPYGKRKATYKITAQAGIGVGGKVKVGGVGIDLSMTGPQISESLSLIIENKTCDGPYNKASLCKETAIDFGSTVSAAAGVGISGTISTKGSMKFCSEAWAWGGKMEVSFCGEIVIKVDVSIQIGATLKHTIFQVPGLPSGCEPVFTHNW